MFDRIRADIDKMCAVACIRGLRIPVATVVGMIADGMTPREILEAYPDLENEDTAQALRYAVDWSRGVLDHLRISRKS